MYNNEQEIARLAGQVIGVERESRRLAQLPPEQYAAQTHSLRRVVRCVLCVWAVIVLEQRLEGPVFDYHTGLAYAVIVIPIVLFRCLAHLVTPGHICGKCYRFHGGGQLMDNVQGNGPTQEGGVTVPFLSGLAAGEFIADLRSYRTPQERWEDANRPWPNKVLTWVLMAGGLLALCWPGF